MTRQGAQRATEDKEAAMLNRMKTIVNSGVLVLVLLLCGPALADDALLGAWEVTEVAGEAVEEDRMIRYAFGAETVTVTLVVAGVSQSFELGYSVADGELTIQPADGIGEAAPLTLGYTVEDDSLTLAGDLLTGRPELTLRRAGG